MTVIDLLKSSNVKRLEYADNVLNVTFVNGRRYRYLDVPVETFGALNKAAQHPTESFGAAFNTLVRKQGFVYEEVLENG